MITIFFLTRDFVGNCSANDRNNPEWLRKPDANGYCTCRWPNKPCEQTRRYKAKQKRNKKKLEMYGKGAKKMRF